MTVIYQKSNDKNIACRYITHQQAEHITSMMKRFFTANIVKFIIITNIFAIIILTCA